VSVKYGNYHIEHIAICCHYCAIVYLSLTKYVYGHLRCLSHDSDLIKFISWYCIKYGRSRSCLGRNVMFCMQKYCNVEKVCCGLMNDVIKLSVNPSTDSHHVAVADLLREIIMVRDYFLLLPRWFTRDDMTLFSVYVSHEQCAACALLCLFFTFGFSKKFAIKHLSCFPPHLNFAATLPCET